MLEPWESVSVIARVVMRGDTNGGQAGATHSSCEKLTAALTRMKAMLGTRQNCEIAFYPLAC